MPRRILGILAVSVFLAACGSDAEEVAELTTGATAEPSTTAAQPTQPQAAALTPEQQFVQEAQQAGDRVFFAFDSFALTGESQSTLRQHAELLQKYPSVNVIIEGHCDERGTREYNLGLGERRAQSVKDFLVSLGVAPGRVETISYGKERPEDPRSTPEAWAQNRRSVTVVK